MEKMVVERAEVRRRWREKLKLIRGGGSSVILQTAVFGEDRCRGGIHDERMNPILALRVASSVDFHAFYDGTKYDLV
jgi:hypothetical protein